MIWEQVMHGIDQNPDKRTRQNEIFQPVQKQVRRGIRPRIFDLILHVGIILMYMIVNIFFAKFTLTVTTKISTQYLTSELKLSTRKTAAANRSRKTKLLPFHIYYPVNS